VDRGSLIGYLRENLGEGLISRHHAHHPEITVDGVEATGLRYLEDMVIVAGLDLVLEGAACWTDRGVRNGEGRRIAHSGYRRAFESACRRPTLRRRRSSPGRRTTAEQSAAGRGLDRDR